MSLLLQCLVIRFVCFLIVCELFSVIGLAIVPTVKFSIPCPKHPSKNPADVTEIPRTECVTELGNVDSLGKICL